MRPLLNGHARRCVIVAASMAVLAGLGVSLSAQGQAQAQAQAPALPPPLDKVAKVDHPGREIFERQCAACHGAGPGDDGAPMLPATATLQRRYQGALSGALELRDDLDGESLRFFVRNGVGAMPSFRKAELSDTQIDQIADYLSATARASAQ